MADHTTEYSSSGLWYRNRLLLRPVQCYVLCTVICFELFGGLVWRLIIIMQVYSITVGFFLTLYCWPKVFYQIQLSMEMSRLTRDGTAEPVSRDQILRHARGQGNINFPCSADHEQDWQPYPVDPYSAIIYVMTIHTYIPSGNSFQNVMEGVLYL